MTPRPKHEHEDHAHLAREVRKNQDEIEQKGGLMLTNGPMRIRKPWLSQGYKPAKKCSVCLGLTGYYAKCLHCKGTGYEPKEKV